MKIEKFKKRANGLYTLYFDNFNTYDLYEEIILKYELLLTKKIEEENFKKIVKENKKYESYYYALKKIKRVIKTKMELKQILDKEGFNKEDIDFSIKTLERQGYINDKNYAKSYIHNSLITTNKGPRKLALELENKGITKGDYEEALEEYTTSIEREKIEKIISKKIASNRNKSLRNLKQKITYDLINLGFSKEIINEVLNEITLEEDDNIKKKEYQKYYNKLSKKYEGKELEYKLKQKMYSLGFDISDINR